MIVKLMETIVYTPNGMDWDAERTFSPSWLAIESAIRRLDKYSFPQIGLFCDENPPYPADFDIMGGKGDWTMYAKFHTRTYFNPAGNPDKLIRVWTSDQGAEAPDANVCHSLETVIATARYFFETGDLDPSVPWDDL